MAVLSPVEKEVLFLYNKHNKSTDYPLEIEDIHFPLYIVKILEKPTKRTAIETKKLAAFRKKVLYELFLKSGRLQFNEEEKRKQKRQEVQKKIAQSKEKKYQDDPTKIKRFGVWLKRSERNKLSRETYAQIDKKVHHKPSLLLEYYADNPTERKKIYGDEECTIYSDEWCAQHRQKCLENFDLNISYFDKLNEDKFESALSSLLKRRKNFESVYDLNEYRQVEGIYVLVLDQYKQVYIGQAKDIKDRVLEHWRAKKHFLTLIWGDVETSVLSIDVFGCLDTTRIFALKTKTEWERNEAEKVLVKAMNSKYLLNRTVGGNHDDAPSVELEILANQKKRIMK